MKTWSLRLFCLFIVMVYVGNVYCGVKELLFPLSQYKGEETIYYYYKKYTEVTLQVVLESETKYTKQEQATIPLAYKYVITTRGKSIQSVQVDSVVVINKQDSVVFVSKNLNFEYTKKNKKKMVFSYQNYDHPDSTMRLLIMPYNWLNYVHTTSISGFYYDKNNDYIFRFYGKYLTNENTLDPFVKDVKVNLFLNN